VVWIVAQTISDFKFQTQIEWTISKVGAFSLVQIVEFDEQIPPASAGGASISR
jgi:hypothetical protein